MQPANATAVTFWCSRLCFEAIFATLPFPSHSDGFGPHLPANSLLNLFKFNAKLMQNHFCVISNEFLNKFVIRMHTCDSFTQLNHFFGQSSHRQSIHQFSSAYVSPPIVIGDDWEWGGLQSPTISVFRLIDCVVDMRLGHEFIILRGSQSTRPNTLRNVFRKPHKWLGGVKSPVFSWTPFRDE